VSIKEFSAEVALAAHTQLGEGPVWDEREQRLFFVDIVGQRVHSFRPDTGAHHSFDVACPVGAVVLREDGGLVLAAHDAFLVADADGLNVEPFGTFRADGAVVRFNDGKVDPRGRFCAGTMDWGGSLPIGSLYMLQPDGTVSVLLDEVTVSNGLAWTADGTTMYYIDSRQRAVDAFKFDLETGALSDRRTVAEFVGMSPDGMAIDVEGCLWVACWDGARVDRIDPANGRRLAAVHLPTSRVSSVAFGGPRLNDLYITTARHKAEDALLAPEPDAGDLFVAQPGVSGPPAFRFRYG